MEQRADPTFKGNLGEGRHGWLRLTPAYSAEMVRRYPPGLARKGGGERAGAEVVFDPFCGSGTTPLVAAQAGHEACALEVNPFLVWLAKAKTARYDPATVKEVRRAGEHLIGLFRSGEAPRADPPPITDIERWWDEAALGFLRSVKGGIEQYRLRRRHRRRHRRRSLASAAGGGNAGKVVDLLRVAFCRTLAKLSDAAFDHQSISPGNEEGGQQNLFDAEARHTDIFASDVKFVTDSAAEGNPPEGPPEVRVLRGDARAAGECLTICLAQGDSGATARAAARGNARYVDRVITSPPHPKRMFYLRALRPYMYWLGYLTEPGKAGRLDWKTIGGTWGVTTSGLTDWARSGEERGYYYPEYFTRKLDAIKSGKNRNGLKMANYVARHFEDTLSHFQSLASSGVLRKRARAHYVVSNSTFHGVAIPTLRLYKEMMEKVGFSEVEVETLRKRNSKKELYEFVVSARYDR